MSDESKPPMRQIAELIDGIATARAESAERLLGECETALIEAQVGEKAALETIADRDAEIAKLKALLDAALATATERQKTIDVILESRKRDYAELAEAREERADLLAENATLADKLADLSATPINATPPAADPRVDALCRVVADLADPTWPKSFGGYRLSAEFRADLETIAARR